MVIFSRYNFQDNSGWLQALKRVFYDYKTYNIRGSKFHENYSYRFIFMNSEYHNQNLFGKMFVPFYDTPVIISCSLI